MAEQDSQSEERSRLSSTGESGAGLDSVHEESHTMPLSLIKKPSAALWRLELNYVISGARDDQLARVGDARWYIESLLDEIEDIALGKTTFHEGLDRFLIEDWQPSVTEDPHVLNIILSLIIAFTPIPGFGKLISFLKRANWIGLTARPPISPNSQIDLHMKALVALHSYYRSAPMNDQSPGFRSYLRVLWGHLKNPSYFGIAAAHLIDLEQIEIDDARLVGGLKKNPESLREIIPLLLSPYRLAYSPQDLGYLYSYCLDIGPHAVSLFEGVVKENGYEVMRGSQPIVDVNGREGLFLKPEPVIVMPDGSVIEVALPEDAVVDYVESNEPEPFSQLQGNIVKPLESQYAQEFEYQIKEQIVQYVHTMHESGKKLDWDELRNELKKINLHLELKKDSKGYQFIVLYNNYELALDLPKATLEILSEAYYDPEKVQKGLFALANSA